MLSILIPTKDYDCHILVEELHRQGESLGLPYEIIIGEDGTAEENLRLNTMADSLTHCRRIIKKTNIGRAAIRNLLARESRYPNLIFIDCDAVVEKDDFLRSYSDALKDYDVVCGALYHANEQPNDECSLRYRYEKEADKQRDAVTRSKAPYDKFTTFNFAIKKDMRMHFSAKSSRGGVYLSGTLTTSCFTAGWRAMPYSLQRANKHWLPSSRLRIEWRAPHCLPHSARCGHCILKTSS